jgi:hypothetical protein
MLAVGGRGITSHNHNLNPPGYEKQCRVQGVECRESPERPCLELLMFLWFTKIKKILQVYP